MPEPAALLRQGLSANRLLRASGLLQARRLIQRCRSGGAAGRRCADWRSALHGRAGLLSRPRRHAALLRTLLLLALLPIELAGLPGLTRLPALPTRRAR